MYHPHPPPRPRRIQLRQQIGPRLQPGRLLRHISHHHRPDLTAPVPAARPAARLGQVPQRALRPAAQLRRRERLHGQLAIPDPAAECLLPRPNSRSINRDAGIPRLSASVSRRNTTSRSSPALVAVPNSSSVYDTGHLPHRGAVPGAQHPDKYLTPPHPVRAQPCGDLIGGWKSAMSTITCPAAETARSAAATYDIPRGKSRSSEVCERNTRHLVVSPEPSKAATRVTPSLGNTLEPASRPGQQAQPCRATGTKAETRRQCRRARCRTPAREP